MKLQQLIYNLMRIPPDFWENEVAVKVEGKELPAGTQVTIGLAVPINTDDEPVQLMLPFEESDADNQQGRLDH